VRRGTSLSQTVILGLPLVCVGCLIPDRPSAPPESSSTSAPVDVTAPYSLPLPARRDVGLLRLEAETSQANASSTASTTLHAAGAEASGRRYASLAPGQSITWHAPAAADSVVVRFSFPDSADGSGRDGTLELQIDGRPSGALPVTSRYSWDYGKPAWGSTDVWSSEPRRGLPRHFWDETSLKLPAPFTANATLTLVNPSASTQTVLIDFIELEAVPAPLPLPEHALSFADYAPAADGVTDDTQKLEQALADAAQQKRTLFVPAGKYRINSVRLSEGTLQGAGMWHTRFVGPHAQLHFMGGTASVSDLAIFGETSHRNDKSDVGNAFTGRPGDGTTIARVWVEHMKCAFWVDRAGEQQGPTRLRITECRFRDLMADAVNFCNGTRDSMVDNSEIRNSGDDSLAAWSPRHGGPPGGHNTFAHNVIASPWVANGIALYGGGPFRVVGNTVSDTVTTGSGIYVSANFDAHGFQGLIDVSDNALIRAGAHESDMGGPTGAIRVLAAEGDMTGAQFLFRNNTVTDPLESAVSIQGPHAITGLQVDGLQVAGAPLLVDVRPGARGEAAFSHVTARGANAGAVRGADSALFKLSR
jgi:hypothetical protein